jgi:hypothetical protein
MNFKGILNVKSTDLFPYPIDHTGRVTPEGIGSASFQFRHILAESTEVLYTSESAGSGNSVLFVYIAAPVDNENPIVITLENATQGGPINLAKIYPGDFAFMPIDASDEFGITISAVNSGLTDLYLNFFKAGDESAAAMTYQSGMYVNDFLTILGFPLMEADLIDFIATKQINDLTFYMSTLLNDANNRTAMRALALQLHNDGQTRIFSNVTQADNCINEADPGTEASYNNGCAVAGEKFTGFTQEWEFWNSGNPYGPFSDFIVDDIAIANYCTANNMTYDIYVSRCEDYSGTYSNSQVADHIVEYHDTVHLVAYITEATYNSNKGLNLVRKEQLELLGNAAIAADKVQKFTILWAANGNLGINMRDWFVANPDLNAYAGFKAAYDAWESPAKAGLELVGQKIYAYSGISDL